jgi:hypothetical protein
VSLRVDYLCRGHEVGTRRPHDGRRVRLASTPRDRHRDGGRSAVEYFGLVDTACHDLRVPGAADHSAYAAYRIGRHLASVSPRRTDRVVVSDELCLVPLLCRADRLPCVLMICSFRHYTASHGGARAFDAAERIVLASWSEVDVIPPALRHKVTAIGPIVNATNLDRGTARARLGLPADGLVGAVSLGSCHPLKVGYFRTVLRAATEAWRHMSATLVVPLPATTVAELRSGPVNGRLDDEPCDAQRRAHRGDQPVGDVARAPGRGVPGQTVRLRHRHERRR